MMLTTLNFAVINLFERQPAKVLIMAQLKKIVGQAGAVRIEDAREAAFK